MPPKLLYFLGRNHIIYGLRSTLMGQLEEILHHQGLLHGTIAEIFGEISLRTWEIRTF